METNISNILSWTLFIQSQLYLLYCPFVMCSVWLCPVVAGRVVVSQFKPGKAFVKVWKRCSVCVQCVFSVIAFYALWDGTWTFDQIYIDCRSFIYKILMTVYTGLSTVRIIFILNGDSTVGYRSPERQVREIKSVIFESDKNSCIYGLRPAHCGRINLSFSETEKKPVPGKSIYFFPLQNENIFQKHLN